jgi:hypothetical protein
VWEEGRWSGSRVTRLSILACSLLIAVDLLLSSGLGIFFDGGFVLLCIAIGLAVRPTDFFGVGVLPPMLMLGFCTILGVVDKTAIATKDDGLIQAVIAGLAHHAGALMVGSCLTLAVLGIRSRVLRRNEERESVPDQPGYSKQAGYSNRDASPAPYRVTSGAPEVKSTTVVGSEPHSPESRTASSS